MCYKGCKWLVFRSWCSREKMYVVESYVSEHSCLVGASKNGRVIENVLAKRSFDEISGIPFIRRIHLKTMVRKDLGVFISSKVCRNALGIGA